MPALPTIDTKVLHYYLTERLGSGEAAGVFRAEDTAQGRWVVLRFLPEELKASRVAMERLRREVATLATLNHPNICTVYEVEEAADRVFLVMEFLEGTSLEELMANGPLAMERVVHVGADVANALASAHSRGIVHREIKPSNVFITRRGFAKVLNFGMPRTPGVAAGGDGLGAQRTAAVPGVLAGTAYMSPEQVRGEELDARSDLFSLGAMLYEMASGRLPFPGANPEEICRAILYDEPAPVWTLNAAVPMEMHPVLMKALEKKPDARYQLASQMSTDLQRLHRDSTGRLAELRTDMAAAPAPAPQKKSWLKTLRNKNGA